jgi:hypothetical protein
MSWWKRIAQQAGNTQFRSSWPKAACFALGAQGFKGTTYVARISTKTGGHTAPGHNHQKALVNPVTVHKTAYGTQGSYGRQIYLQGGVV